MDQLMQRICDGWVIKASHAQDWFCPPFSIEGPIWFAPVWHTASNQVIHRVGWQSSPSSTICVWRGACGPSISGAVRNVSHRGQIYITHLPPCLSHWRGAKHFAPRSILIFTTTLIILILIINQLMQLLCWVDPITSYSEICFKSNKFRDTLTSFFE